MNVVILRTSLSKEHEYAEGPEAQENFERGMKALFHFPAAHIVHRVEALCFCYGRATKRQGRENETSSFYSEVVMTTAFPPCLKRIDWRPLYTAAILETNKRILRHPSFLPT